MKGIIVKGIGGFYYVKADNGSVYQCRGRGILKKDGIVPAVGDLAEITVLEDGDGVIEKISPRKNIFIRPPIANVDCFVVVASVRDPEPNLTIIDKFLVMAEKNHTEALLCINKKELASEEELKAICRIYEGLYPVFLVSAVNGEGMDALGRSLAGKKCALAGPSGVGKSTILNNLKKVELMETGEISRKTGRGKHTTRHVEIFDGAGGGLIFDTPGFTSFDVLEAGEEELQFLYPEFAPFIGKCRYDNCRHMREPDCAVRRGVKEGAVRMERYRSYAAQLLEIREKERNKY